MIGKLAGIVDSYGPDWLVLDVHGVGYLVHCSAKTLEALPARGEAAMLFIAACSSVVSSTGKYLP